MADAGQIPKLIRELGGATAPGITSGNEALLGQLGRGLPGQVLAGGGTELQWSYMPRTLAGAVNSSGGIVDGTGFTVTKNTTGDYTVTFTVAFTYSPNVQVCAAEQANFVFVDLVSHGQGSFRVNTASATGVGADRGFSFLVTGQPN